MIAGSGFAGFWEMARWGRPLTLCNGVELELAMLAWMLWWLLLVGRLAGSLAISNHIDPLDIPNRIDSLDISTRFITVLTCSPKYGFDLLTIIKSKPS